MLAVSPETGDTLNTIELDAPPNFDALIAAEEKLFFSAMDGSVQCYGTE